MRPKFHCEQNKPLKVRAFETTRGGEFFWSEV